MSILDNLVDRARKSKLMKKIYLKVFSPYVDLHVRELSLTFDLRPSENEVKRLNLLVPSISREHVFGGIATAIDYFNRIAEAGGFQKRIIIINAEPGDEEIGQYFPGYRVAVCGEESPAEQQILPCRQGRLSIPVGREDLFFATAWWTAYCAQKMAAWQAAYYQNDLQPILYLIQDFEPGFYPWSSEYLLAESTYKYVGPQIALFNTKLLKTFFNRQGYCFTHEFYFEPGINAQLLQYKKVLDLTRKKKQILIYGRPSTPRNAFPLIVESLKVWSKLQPDAAEWKLLSVGEKHRDLDVGNGVTLKSLGKLSLADYARLLAESRVGLSLMVSPHPSYPPLEMAEYGLHVVTNSFQAKDLSSYYANIISLKKFMPDDIAAALEQATRKEPLSGGIKVKDADSVGGEEGLIAGIVRSLTSQKAGNKDS